MPDDAKLTTEFTRTSMARIFKKAGALRVEKDAKDLLSSILYEHGKEIARKAVEFAGNGGRKTITAEDVRLATQWYFKKEDKEV